MKKKPYIPSSGTEGVAFIEKWCEQCTRHSLSPDAKTQCIHLLRSFVEDDNKRWYYVNDQPTCIAFRDKKKRKRYPRKQKIDKNQLKLF